MCAVLGGLAAREPLTFVVHSPMSALPSSYRMVCLKISRPPRRNRPASVFPSESLKSGSPGFLLGIGLTGAMLFLQQGDVPQQGEPHFAQQGDWPHFAHLALQPAVQSLMPLAIRSIAARSVRQQRGRVHNNYERGNFTCARRLLFPFSIKEVNWERSSTRTSPFLTPH